MKKNYTLFFLLCLMSNIQAQIIYTNNSFPVAGDILSIATSYDSTIAITPPSAAATVWDFSQLVAFSTRKDTIQAASVGRDFLNFPTADILLPAINDLGITYTEVSNSAITSIAGGIELFGLSFVAPYTNTHVRQTAPLNYNDSDVDDYALNFAEHIDSVPFLRQLIDSLAANAGVPLSPDSIRVTVNGTDNRVVDAWGTCVLADSTYDVLRQKVTSTYSIGIEVSITLPYIGAQWIDLSSVMPLPFPTSGTIARYDFLAENIKQPVVSLTMDSLQNNVAMIEFLYTSYNTNNSVISLATTIDANIYPNPAQEYFFIHIPLASLPNEGYTLHLVDAFGRVIKEQAAIKEEFYQVQTSNLPSGNYWLILKDSKGSPVYHEGVVIP